MLHKKVIVISLVMLFVLGASLSVHKTAHYRPQIRMFADLAHAQPETFNVLKEEVPMEGAEQISDPLEPLNRVVFNINDKLYLWLFKPIAIGYKTIIPENLRIPIRNSFYNIRFPVRVVNNLLQGKLEGAGTELASFVINSTIGFGGMFEPAQKEFHFKRYKEDFGQTLGVYRMPPVFYIVLPVLGPSNLRDSFGRGGDYFLNPIDYLVNNWLIEGSIWAGEGVNEISLHLGEYEDFKKAALDPYVSMRSAYYQYRQNQIRE
jgi:phospholipid-binding lipoprotein MlaA